MNIYLKKPQELYDAGLGETTLINYVRIFFHLNGLFYFSVWAYFHISYSLLPLVKILKILSAIFLSFMIISNVEVAWTLKWNGTLKN